MKKIPIVFSFVLIVILSGCQTHQAYTFNIGTGDVIKIQLNTSYGEKLMQEDGQFIISSEEGEYISIGMFLEPDVLNQLYSNVNQLDGVEIISENKNSDMEYIFYKISTETMTEWNYLMKHSHSQAGIVISNITSEGSAKGIFELLSFEVN